MHCRAARTIPARGLCLYGSKECDLARCRRTASGIWTILQMNACSCYGLRHPVLDRTRTALRTDAPGTEEANCDEPMHPWRQPPCDACRHDLSLLYLSVLYAERELTASP
jgi:hypothetical protein